MAGFKEFAHEIRKRATDYTNATIQHVALYAKDNNRVYIIDENGNLVDFQVADIFCYNIDVSETAEVGETLSVSGNGYFWSDVNVEDNTYIGGIVDVSGNGYFWSDVLIDGNLLVNSNVAIGENLEVSGNSYFYGDVVMGDDLEVAGNVVVGENLEVSGNSYFYGDVVVGDDLEVVGDASISGSLYIAGKLTVDGLIDPTGLQLTPVSANPGDANTIWVNSNDNSLYFGNTALISGNASQSNNSLIFQSGNATYNIPVVRTVLRSISASTSDNLPLCSNFGNGNFLTIKRVDGSVGNTLTLNRNGSDTLDGAVLSNNSLTTGYSSITFVCYYAGGASGVWYSV